MVDPFNDKDFDPNFGSLIRFYTYDKIIENASEVNVDTISGRTPPFEAIDGPGRNPGAMSFYGKYRLVSVGPDHYYFSAPQVGGPYAATMNFTSPLYGSDILYDPTNGTISWGNILYTQRYKFGKTTLPE